MPPSSAREARGRRPRRPDRAARAALVLLAAGSGTRGGADTNKVLLPLAGRRVLTWSLTWTDPLAAVVDTVVVIRPSDFDHVTEVLRSEAPGRPVHVVAGGSTRHSSEFAALTTLAPRIEAGEVDVVVIHDAARPLAGTRLFADAIDTAHVLGGALPVLGQPGLLPVNGGTPPVETLVTVQTPQAFRALPLLEAYRAADRAGFDGTDTAVCIQRFGSLSIRGLPGTAANIKITFPEDLFLAERILAAHHWHLP
ncbi:MAG: 2-C-methyl-D-erythritol 4-phosphate cytidylyltransferase [Kineosporiaceae bacterium]